MSTHSKLLSIIFIPLLIGAMDQPKKDDESIVKIIELSGVREIAFIGNKDVAIRLPLKKPFILNIDSQKRIDFMDNQFDCFSPTYMVTDQAKKRVLISSGCNGVDNQMIYDFCTGSTVTYPNVCSDFGVDWQNAFDERKPNSVLLLQKWPTLQDRSRIISYDYLNNAAQLELELFPVPNYGSIYSHVFNARLGTRGILSETKEEFKIDMESISGDVKALSYKKAILGSIQKNFVCSSDLSFIAYYSSDQFCSHNPLNTSMEYMRRVCRVCDVCYILNLKTSKNICCLNKFGGVIPCAMDFHPNNKVVATFSLDGDIEYWKADSGELLGSYGLSQADENRRDRSFFRKYLSFSADGELLVVAFKERCVVYKVPFKVLYGIHKNKAIAILWCLKNMDPLLPRDIQELLVDRLKL